MKKDKHTTDVIFRKFPEGDIIALFPGEAGNDSPYTCGSYMHVGQHGTASAEPLGTIASPVDYAALARELEDRGYNLRVVKRFTQRHFAVRYKQAKREGYSRA